MSLPHALLAALDFYPMTGYDLKKFMDRSAGDFWTTTQSHIYTALNSLEKKGWVQKEIISQDDKPNKKVYSLTQSGAVELRRWMVTPLPNAPVREAWLIQLFFSHKSTDAEIIHLLKTRIKNVEELLKEYEDPALNPINHDVPKELIRARSLWSMAREYGRAYYEFELAQNKKLLEKAKDLPPLNP